MDKIGEVQRLLKPHGLTLLGCLNFDADAPVMSDGSLAMSVMLVGNVGGAPWPAFTKWCVGRDGHSKHPLDDWSKSVLGPIADHVSGEAVFPSDVPYHPFQRWASRALGLQPSPLGLLIHPVFGLWFAYRGAILFSNVKLNQVVETLIHPCEICVDKPCLSACPVNAFSSDGFAVKSCRSHVATVHGQACMSGGCFARLACPVGKEFHYGADQMQFHMRAFAK